MPSWIGRCKLVPTWLIYPGQPPGFPSLTPDAKLLPIHLAPSMATLPQGQTPIPEPQSVTTGDHQVGCRHTRVLNDGSPSSVDMKSVMIAAFIWSAVSPNFDVNPSTPSWRWLAF